MIVDPDKLNQIYDIVYCEILEREFGSQSGESYQWAVDDVAEELGFDLERFRLGYWSAVSLGDKSALDEMHLYGDNCDWDRACDVDLERRQLFLSPRPESAEIAAIAHALDAELDLFMNADRERMFYSDQMIEEADRLVQGIVANIHQHRWFGDVPQSGAYFEYALEILPRRSVLKWVPADEW